MVILVSLRYLCQQRINLKLLLLDPPLTQVFERNQNNHLERLSKHTHFCFLDGYSGFSQIPVSVKDQDKTTFTCPFGTFDYRRMPFGLCNAPATFQRCMMAIFSDFCEWIVEVFMDDFSVYGSSFDDCLSNLD